jgi:hypothetical protein
LALSKKIFAQLVKFESVPRSQWSLDRAKSETIAFRWCCLKEARAIRDEFAEAHFIDHKLDEILKEIPSDANAPSNEIIRRADMEQIARSLTVLASPKGVVPRYPPRILHFDETQLPATDTGHRFNVTVTINTKVPLPVGYIVVEFSVPLVSTETDFITGKHFDRAEITDNQPLTDYLDKLPYRTYTQEVGNAPFVPDKAIHVRAHSSDEFHVTKVTWFDN